MLRYNHVGRSVSPYHHQQRPLFSSSDDIQKVESRRIAPLQVLETENQGSLPSKDFERFTELAQHPGLCGALHSFMESFYVLIGNVARHLRQPCGSVAG